jgi:nicotinamide riboside transporter PnuC
MRILDRIDKLGAAAHDWRTHAGAVVFFLAVNGAGYALGGGIEFVQGWGGGLAAVIATVFLVWKSQGYWLWMVANASLWCALFFHEGLPILCWLQVGFLLYAAYGSAQWALHELRIGWDPRIPTDLAGAALAAGFVGFAVFQYRSMDGYAGTTWWWLELTSVVAAIAAMALDAFRYKANWIAWTLSDAAFVPLAFHGRLWGPFALTFVYQAINVAGWFQWVRDERRVERLVAPRVLVREAAR